MLARVGTLTALMLLTSLAAAQPSAVHDAARSRALFYEGKQLIAAGALDEGCAKMQLSYALSPAPGTQFQLASCHEAQGRTKSAFVAFVEVASEARRAGKPAHERLANARAERLRSRLSYLRVDVPAATEPEAITINGERLPRSSWGEPILVDPGPYVVAARGLGRGWRDHLEIDREGTTVTVTVPSVRDEAPATQRRHSVPSHGLTQQHAWAIACASVGAVGLGLGTAFAISWLSDANDADARQQAVESRNTSITSYAIAGAAIGGAVLLWFTADDDSDDDRAQARWVAVPGGVGVEVVF